eukprot:COSAG01_NODE_38246_length_492_cov_0.689567_1_plen_112_part_10
MGSLGRMLAMLATVRETAVVPIHSAQNHPRKYIAPASAIQKTMRASVHATQASRSKPPWNMPCQRPTSSLRHIEQCAVLFHLTTGGSLALAGSSGGAGQITCPAVSALNIS